HQPPAVVPRSYHSAAHRNPPKRSGRDVRSGPNASTPTPRHRPDRVRPRPPTPPRRASTPTGRRNHVRSTTTAPQPELRGRVRGWPIPDPPPPIGTRTPRTPASRRVRRQLGGAPPARRGGPG